MNIAVSFVEIEKESELKLQIKNHASRINGISIQYLSVLGTLIQSCKTKKNCSMAMNRLHVRFYAYKISPLAAFKAPFIPLLPVYQLQ